MKSTAHKVNDAYKDLVKQNLLEERMLIKKRVQQEAKHIGQYEKYLRNPAKQKVSKEELKLQKKQSRKEKKAQTQLAKKQRSIDAEIKQPIPEKDGGLRNKKSYEKLADRHLLALGEALERRSEFAEARELYLLAAERGSLEALFNLAELAESENLGEKDFVLSFNYTMSAAKSGYVPAMEVVAHNYFFGVGIEKDEIKSAAFIIAAHALEPDLVLGSFYQLKRLINKDTFDLGRTLSYSIFATDDQAISLERKVEDIRLKKKADAIKAADVTSLKENAKKVLKVSRETHPQKYNDNAAKKNKEGWDPVWFFPLFFVVMPLIIWFLREARHG